ncbi:MAG TPA: Tat pathway signal sequence domain protein [Opitutaceae bacterium]|nr:Tat pathway signal sequence domain protein [Opitutaceae bacterium]
MIHFFQKARFAATSLRTFGLTTLAATGIATAAAVPAPVSVHWLGEKPPAMDTGVSWGVPWPEGTVPKGQAFSLTTVSGQKLPLQTWPLAYWPDGSLKWSGFATVLPDGTSAPLEIAPLEAAATASQAVSVRESGKDIEVNTGRLVCRIPRTGDTLFDSISIDGRQVAGPARLVCILQNGPDGDPVNSPKRQEFVGRVEKVTVEQAGPVRAVLKIEGKHRALHGTREWLPFTVRLYFYAGQLPIRVVHTIVYDGDQNKDFIRGLGLEFSVPMREQAQNRHVRFAAADGGLWAEPIQPGAGNVRQDAGEPIEPRGFYGDKGDYAIWSDFRLMQSSPDGFTIEKRTNPQSTWIFSDAGRRADGFAFVGDVKGGLGVSVKNFWQSFPDELDVRNAAAPVATLTTWLWSPDGPAMDLRHYDTRAHGLIATYEDVQPGLSTPYGVARTSELTLFPTEGVPSKPATVTLAQAGEKLPLLVATPAYIHSTGVFGVWSLPDRSTPAKAAVEDRLNSVLAYYEQQVDERSWYGFWHYGDFIHSYNRAGHVWYYDFGGHAWDNTELAAPLWMWYSFLRTGRDDLFRLAEAHTRNTSETCVYHIGPMAGLGSRHNVSKWGDGAKEARISQAAHWRPFYYLTTDERTGDIMHEMVHSDVAAIRYDPMREAQPVLPQDPKYPGRLRIGPDWFALVGNWMTEWERTGDTRWRDRILAGVDSILAMPYWIRSGVRDGLNPDLGKGKIGPLKGGGSMTVGYDPATGRLLPIPDPIAHAQVPVNYNLATIQGGAEVMFELVPLLGRADWAKAWLQYCRLGDAPADVLTRDKTTGKEGADAQYIERGQGGPRLAAWAYAQTKDPAFAKYAINALSRRNWVLNPQPVNPPDSLHPIHEVPFMSTNEASQSSLSAIEILALCGDQLPNELPPAPRFEGFGRRGPRPEHRPTGAEKAGPTPDRRAPPAAADPSPRD